jgi:spore coat protein U-like protein
MKARVCWLVALLLWAAPAAVQAAITCSITSPGFSAAYDPTSANANITQTFFTITCTRGLTSDPTSVSYQANADNGLFASNGNHNHGAFGASRIGYDLFRDSTCSTQWRGGGGAAINGTISFSGTGTVTQNVTYWGCVPAGQSVPNGTYTDTVTMTLNYGGTIVTGSFGVSITTPASCSLTTAPAALIFNYLSQGALVNASTTYGVTCTLSLPYSVALDALSGTVLGLSYTLSLATPSSVGTGSEQTQTINGSMAAGQSGTCATGTCIASQARTLTISY